MIKQASISFSGGVVGALINSLAVWLFGVTKLNNFFHVAIAPALSAQWLYPRLVWGGLWGLLFALPMFRKGGWSRGLWISLGPTCAQLLYFFPYQAHKGFFGVQLGLLTPIVVVIFNALWGISAVAWLGTTNTRI